MSDPKRQQSAGGPPSSDRAGVLEDRVLGTDLTATIRGRFANKNDLTGRGEDGFRVGAQMLEGGSDTREKPGEMIGGRDLVAPGSTTVEPWFWRNVHGSGVSIQNPPVAIPSTSAVYSDGVQDGFAALDRAADPSRLERGDFQPSLDLGATRVPSPGGLVPSPEYIAFMLANRTVVTTEGPDGKRRSFEAPVEAGNGDAAKVIEANTWYNNNVSYEPGKYAPLKDGAAIDIAPGLPDHRRYLLQNGFWKDAAHLGKALDFSVFEESRDPIPKPAIRDAISSDPWARIDHGAVRPISRQQFLDAQLFPAGGRSPLEVAAGSDASSREWTNEGMSATRFPDGRRMLSLETSVPGTSSPLRSDATVSIGGVSPPTLSSTSYEAPAGYRGTSYSSTAVVRLGADAAITPRFKIDMGSGGPSAAASARRATTARDPLVANALEGIAGANIAVRRELGADPSAFLSFKGRTSKGFPVEGSMGVKEGHATLMLSDARSGGSWSMPIEDKGFHVDSDGLVNVTGSAARTMRSFFGDPLSTARAIDAQSRRGHSESPVLRDFKGPDLRFDDREAALRRAKPKASLYGRDI